jgi:RNA polymerase sigma-70 factor (ECF subfamily)
MEKAVPRSGEPSPPAAAGRAEGASCQCDPRPDIALLDIVTLVTEHHAAAYRYAFRLTGSAVDAEDLVQQAFLLAHQRLAQLRETSRAAGWLMAIVRNCFLKDKRRTRPTEPLLDEPLGPDEEEFPEWVDPEQLQLALGQLPDEARAIVVLFFFEDCSYKEIAESLGVPLGTVMSRLSRAKTRLRQLLTDTPQAKPVRQLAGHK